MNNNIKTLILVLILLGFGWWFYTMSQSNPQSTDTLVEVETMDQEVEQAGFTDERACLTNGVSEELTEEYLLGKAFVNYDQDGEWGTFKEDGIVTTGWGEGEEAVSENEAIWGVLDGSLSVRHSRLTDGVYEGFLFYSHNGETFAIPEGGHWLFIGPSQDLIEGFFNAKYLQEICRETSAL